MTSASGLLLALASLAGRYSCSGALGAVFSDVSSQIGRSNAILTAIIRGAPQTMVQQGVDSRFDPPPKNCLAESLTYNVVPYPPC
jgi:hypothetical protein